MTNQLQNNYFLWHFLVKISTSFALTNAAYATCSKGVAGRTDISIST
jgi:hypothetical protein